MVCAKEKYRTEAIILGNGPSLKGFDFDRLSQFDVFGMNAAYRYWYEIGWFPQYYACLDLVVGLSHRDAISDLIKDSEQLGIRGFLLRSNLIEALGRDGASRKVFNFDLIRPGYENWIPGPVTTGSHTCAWASILGYKDIYLLGIDCNYIEIVDNAKQVNGTVLEIVSDSPNPNYFFDSYQKRGDKFNIPNPRKDLHLEGWRNVGEKIINHSKVLNANLSSKVDAFPFVQFEDVEKGGHIPIFSPSDVLGTASLHKPVDHIFIPSKDQEDIIIKVLQKPVGELQKSQDEQYKLKRTKSILAYDAEWNSKEHTERHAYRQAVKLLPEVQDAIYFGFPWATLIEKLKTKESTAADLKFIVNRAKVLLKSKKRIVTVCQHADMLEYQNLFVEGGITHLFWTHAVSDKTHFTENGDIQILPFPIHPFSQYTPLTGNSKRNYLYSFVESKDTCNEVDKPYEIIFSCLSDRTDGLVIPCEKWNFEGLCYRKTIENDRNSSRNFGRRCRSIEVDRILGESVFSICPLLPFDPHVTRVWESIACGSIPVIFSNDYLPPGNRALWEETTVFCPNGMEDIQTLPERLESIASDNDLLERKRHALQQIWMIYGADCFVYDIVKLFLSFMSETRSIAFDLPSFSFGKFKRLVSEMIGKNSSVASADIFILGCRSRMMTDPDGFFTQYYKNKDLQFAYKRAIRLCSPEYAKSINTTLKFKQIVLEKIPYI